jgi:hypothetical protein
MSVVLFEKRPKTRRIPKLRQYANKQLPISREHLKMARSPAEQR